MNNIIDLIHIKQVVEICLLTAADPISKQQLADVFDQQVGLDIIECIISELVQEYTNRSLELVSLASGYRFRSRLEFQPYLNKLNQIKPARYSKAVMETLAIIAYHQPVTRGEIEDIRGVALNTTALQSLIERGWVEGIGYKQLPGKPELLATTAKFLDEIGITSLQELPPLPEIDTHAIDGNQDLLEEYDSEKQSYS